MSLYIRLQTSYWKHRKTLRLRAILGAEAVLLPLKLWSYAAENQPDGDFSDYTAEELAMLLECSSNAQAMLEAMQQAGFLDGMKIHKWHEHNAYHSIFSQRAKVAAETRWQGYSQRKEAKERNEKKGKEQAMLEHASSNASSIPCDNDMTPPPITEEYIDQLRAKAERERDERHAKANVYSVLDEPRRDYTPEEIEANREKMAQLKANLLNQPF